MTALWAPGNTVAFKSICSILCSHDCILRVLPKTGSSSFPQNGDHSTPLVHLMIKALQPLQNSHQNQVGSVLPLLRLMTG